jgi:hypothetical protein
LCGLAYQRINVTRRSVPLAPQPSHGVGACAAKHHFRFPGPQPQPTAALAVLQLQLNESTFQAFHRPLHDEINKKSPAPAVPATGLVAITIDLFGLFSYETDV